MQTRFKEAWKRLSRVGKCDGYGGAECKRVYSEWKEVGYPSNIEEFIQDRASVVDEEEYEANLRSWRLAALKEDEEIRLAYAEYKQPLTSAETEEEMEEEYERLANSLDLDTPEAEAFFLGYAAAIETQQQVLCDALQEHSLLPPALEKALRKRRQNL